jgi:hypothetical protein
MFVTVQRENIRPSKKEMDKALTPLTLQNPNCPMFAVRLWIATSRYRSPVGSLPSTYSLRTVLRALTPCRNQLVISGHYMYTRLREMTQPSLTPCLICIGFPFYLSNSPAIQALYRLVSIYRQAGMTSALKLFNEYRCRLQKQTQIWFCMLTLPFLLQYLLESTLYRLTERGKAR